MFKLNGIQAFSLLVIAGGLYTSLSSFYYFENDYTEFLFGLAIAYMGLQSLLTNPAQSYIILGFLLILGILVLIFSSNVRFPMFSRLMGVITITISVIEILRKFFSKPNETKTK